ncbi:uncharacterized protein ASPGLDRAFT_49496 [Aspergillus glaucus CBS 516.65]|uniref:MARVEL domain-containing protein n=1 Tax=Aspergillus glaucus CBS 516.65 TaxID=1160497 RepID=A0A1L9VDX8_ASPGL|nr:hypothetical protein ASPGLDRAFT_49496 [Aspergillus glaucus CBS 516.65]OJJ82095.1 hypothetical protein ASPGLDRAFT_49496 [Aspergillus glaucus CBS 516.65]
MSWKPNLLYFPRNHRYHKVLLWLMAVELPFIIVILTFTGIASHDLYRTRLWQDGADNGFNSAPDEILYAMANYRPYKVPKVWSSFTDDYNLALGVLSTFFLITKVPLHFLRLFYPPVSAFVHAGLFAVYIASASFQAGSDMSDPKHPQKGAPWHIAKSCSVAAHPNNIEYCKQAKAMFAMTIIVIILYFVELVLSLHSCVPTKEEIDKRRERQEEKRTMKEYEEEILKSPVMIPMTPGPNTGGLPSMTPHSFVFNPMTNGPSDLPFRNEPGSRVSTHQESAETLTSGPHFFPPPPKAVTK